MDGSDLAAFCDHAFCVCGCSFYLAADRAVYDGCDLRDYFLKVAAFFGDQRRIGCNSADDPHIVCLADVFYISSINEKSHKQNPPQIAVFHTGLYIYYSAIQHNVKHNIAKKCVNLRKNKIM